MALGYSVKDLVGKNIKILVPTDVESMHDQYIKDFLATGKSQIVNGGIRNVRFDGDVVER